MILRIERHYCGPRLYVLGLRCHHGLTCLLVTLACIAGMWHDRRDWRDWMRFR